MVRRVVAVFAGVVVALALCACTPSSPPSSVTPTAEATTPAVPQVGGDYLLTVSDDVCMTHRAGHVLTVSDGKASLAIDGGGSATGPVETDGAAVSIVLTFPGNGGLQMSLTGAPDSDGVIRGHGEEGIPGGAGGCGFDFALLPQAPADATLPDGDYVLQVDPECPTAMDGRVLNVSGGRASFLMESGFTMTGAATTRGRAVSIDLELTEPSVIKTTLDGTLYAGAVVAGSGDNGGIHPGGETGYACTFAFIMTPAPEKPTASADVDCSQAALQTAQDAASTGERRTISDGQFVCSGEWAAAGLSGAEDQVTGVFHWEDSRWAKKPRAEACASGGIPADIADLACNSN